MSRHPSIEHLVSLLKVNENLPAELKKISARFEILRDDLLNDVQQDTPEIAAGLRKLLEAKDCFVRAGHLVMNQAPELVNDATNDPAPSSAPVSDPSTSATPAE